MSRPGPGTTATRTAVRDALTDLDAGDVVLVACSGGADSLALAAATAFVAPRAGLSVAGITVDHGLQPGSTERAAAVADAMTSMGVAPAEIVRVDVSGGGGPEAAARRARYAALDDAAARLDARAVLLGHTLDDQAETVLLGLAQGSGARSLAGMRPVDGLLRRPFLGLGRATTVAACAETGLVPWRDPHNSDPAYTRARVRDDALPALEKALGPGVADALARTATMLRVDADLLDDLAVAALAEVRGEDGSLDCVALGSTPPAVRRRVLHRAALDAGATHRALSHGHVLALDALVAQWSGQGPVALPGGVEGVRSCGRLYLRRLSGGASPDPSEE